MNGGRGSRNAGYTILETIIFLAVSGAMFVSAMAIVGGRQARAEFNQAVRTFEASLQDVANDVSTGYYADADQTGSRINCRVAGASIRLGGSGAAEQGARKDCLFIGKSIQFGPSEEGQETYNLITLVGKRLVGGSTGADVQNYSEADITAVAPDGVQPAIPDATDNIAYGSGAAVMCAFYATNRIVPASIRPCTNTNGVTRLDTLSFITTFHGLNSAGELESGSSQVDLVVYSSATNVGRSKTTVVRELNSYTEANTVVNPAGGVYICLESGGTDQYSLVRIGGDNSRFIATAHISEGDCI